MTPSSTLRPADIQAFKPDAKIGILATVNAQGLPHLSLITSLQAKSSTQLMFGQFCEGQSKQNLRHEPRVGFAVMTLDRKLWRGRARWTHALQEGDDFVGYNQQPMFRYNAYFGIHTVHYLDLVELTERRSVSIPTLLAGSARTSVARMWPRHSRHEVLKPWSHDLLAQLGVLKFAAYVDDEGWPHVVPVVPCQPTGKSRLVLAPLGGRSDLLALPADSALAVLGLSLKMESVLVRGRTEPPKLGAVGLQLEWVYNSMPPIPGQIYPPTPLTAVEDYRFDALS